MGQMVAIIYALLLHVQGSNFCELAKFINYLHNFCSVA